MRCSFLSRRVFINLRLLGTTRFMKNAAMNSGNASWKECGLHFQNEKFSDALVEAVKEIGTVLESHFPKTSDDTNELPNDVIES